MTTDLRKANFTKRIAAALLDFVLLAVLVSGAATLLAVTFGYDSHADTIDARRQHFENQYGIKFEITQEEYDALDEAARENFDEAFDALLEDEAFLRAYNMQISLTMLITTFSVLFGVLAVEFAIPLFLKNGQTVGKKIFGIALLRTDGVQVSKLQMFIRAVLGKFTIELMIPIYAVLMVFFNAANIFTLAILGGLLLGQLVCVAATRTNSPIHDLLAGTAAVDMATQMIFKSREDLLEYTKKLHAEEANRAEYF